MTLKEMSMKSLLALHNSLAATPAGPKTFSTKGKLIERIEALQRAVPVDSMDASAADPRREHRSEATEVTEKPQDGVKRVGDLAKSLLIDPIGYPHAVIAAMVNAEIEGAAATANSVRWYASKMRKQGIDVPPRSKAKVFPAYMDEKQSNEWLKTITLVKEGEE